LPTSPLLVAGVAAIVALGTVAALYRLRSDLFVRIGVTIIGMTYVLMATLERIRGRAPSGAPIGEAASSASESIGAAVSGLTQAFSKVTEAISNVRPSGGEGGGPSPIQVLKERVSGILGSLGGGGGGLFERLTSAPTAVRRAGEGGGAESEDVERIKALVFGELEEESEEDTQRELMERLQRLQRHRKSFLEELMDTLGSSDVFLALANRFKALAPSRDELIMAGIKATPVQFMATVLGVTIPLAIIITALVLILPVPMSNPALAPIITAVKAMVPIIMFISPVFLTKMIVRMRIKQRENEIRRNLPYAIRQMATEVSAGLSLIESIKSVSESDYGALSEEFRRVLKEINSGTPVNVALQNLANRWDIEGLRTAVRFIIQAMESGANVAEALMTIADEIANELRQAYREYANKLQAMSFMYIMMIIVFPAMGVVLIIATSAMSGKLILPPNIFGLVIGMGIGAMAFVMIWFFKSMEPKL